MRTNRSGTSGASGTSGTTDTAARSAAAGGRLLVPASALVWGLQFAFLNPVVALLLVALYDATPGDVGWALAVYNAGGFVAALVIPAWADRSGDYLRPLLAAGMLTLALAGALFVISALPLAAVALVVLGGPAGVGTSLLFADQRHSGVAPRDIIRTRAIISFAWVAGPTLATVIIGVWGERSILVTLALLAVLNIATTLAMIRRRHRARPASGSAVVHDADAATPAIRVRLLPVAALVAGFTVLQATNSAAVAVMSLFVTQQLGLPLVWSGVALGVSALVEIPALLAVGALTERFSSRALIASGCVAGIVYYAVMAVADGPVVLLAAQVLNAWFFAVVAGIGLTVFQDAIPRPGLASGLYLNTRRVGAILSGGLIAAGASTPLAYHGVFALCGAATVVAFVALMLVKRASASHAPTPGSAPNAM